MADSRIKEGEELFTQGDREGAARKFTEVLETNPGQVEALNNLACIFAAQGEEKKAEEHLLKAYGIDANYPPVLENLAELYKGSGDRSSELAFRIKAVEAEPENTKYMNALGICWLESGDAQKALSVLRNSLNQDPTQETVKAAIREIEQATAR